jgi:membrane associated rhomboid family serine protease
LARRRCGAAAAVGGVFVSVAFGVISRKGAEAQRNTQRIRDRRLQTAGFLLLAGE